MSSPISWDIDEGEKQAIDLARELAADIVLMDDFEGRRAARSLGLAVVGTLGVLLAAGSRRLIDFERAFSALEETSFQVSEEVKNEVLRLWRARRTRK